MNKELIKATWRLVLSVVSFISLCLAVGALFHAWKSHDAYFMGLATFWLVLSIGTERGSK